MDDSTDAKLEELRNLVDIYFSEEVDFMDSATKYFVKRRSNLNSVGGPMVVRVDNQLDTARRDALMDIVKLAIQTAKSHGVHLSLSDSIELLAKTERDRWFLMDRCVKSLPE
ncbi:hypothetical protein HDE_12947 [Halotydeus destructor]|nr:hypothetical protein HDE_12947 [Halotydeus destructor]